MAVVIVAKQSSEQGGYTAYGWFVREILNRRKIKSQKRAAELISTAGYPISQPGLSKVLTGRTEPSRRLNAAIAEALSMDAAERNELANIFSYTDNTQILSEENYEGMREIQREAQEDADRRARGSEEARGTRRGSED